MGMCMGPGARSLVRLGVQHHLNWYSTPPQHGKALMSGSCRALVALCVLKQWLVTGGLAGGLHARRVPCDDDVFGSHQL